MGRDSSSDNVGLTSSATHIYLSPHLDDAALSCGGTIWKQTRAGQRVVVINIFAGVPDYTRLPAFAQEKHSVWGSPDDVVATRRAEDQAALAHLGADVVYWNYLDCIYRLDGSRALYPGEAHLWGDVDPADGALQDQIVTDVEAALEEVEDVTCYAPLGIGHHVDHQIVRDVGLVLAGRGRRVRFYEDFPYVWRNCRSEAERCECVEGEKPPFRPASSLHGDWESGVRPVEIEPKITAIACYQSQVSDLFGSAEAMAQATREYAQFVGGGYSAERLWCLLRVNDER